MSAILRPRSGSFSLLQRLSFNILETRQFQLTSRKLVRKSNKGSSLLTKQTIDDESHFYPKTNSLKNFYGIESDEGVVYIERRGDENMKLIYSIPTNNVTVEKFKTVRFGSVRLDSDNKPQFHGQYETTENLDNLNSFQGTQSLLKNDLSSKDAYYTRKFEIQRTSHSVNERMSDRNANYNISQTDQDELSKVDSKDGFNNEGYFTRESSDGMGGNKSNLKYTIQTTGYSPKNIHSETYNTDCNVSIDDSSFYNPKSKKQDADPSKCTKKVSSFIDDQYFDNNLLENLTNSTTLIKPSESFITGEDGSIQNPSCSTPRGKLQDADPTKNTRQISSFIDDQYFGNNALENTTNKANLIKPSESDSSGKGSTLFDENYFEDLMGRDLSYKQDPSVYNTDFPMSTTSNKTTEKLGKAVFPENNASNVSPSHIKFPEIPLNTSYSKVSENPEETIDINPDIASEIGTRPFKSRGNISRTSLEKSKQHSVSKLTKDIDMRKKTPNLLETQPIPMTRNPQTSTENEKQSKTDETETAYEFVNKLRSESKLFRPQIKGGKILPSEEKYDFKGFRILSYQVPKLSYFTREEIMTVLKNNVLYSDDDIMVLNKPYNMVMHDSQTTKDPCISQYLEELARELDDKSEDPKLITVHRLDKETCGCLLLARNEKAAQRLLTLFAQRKIIKTYWIVTINVPDPEEGVIDIPISEGSVDKKTRMVLHPNLPKDVNYAVHSKRGKRAVTSYKTIATAGNAALVEVQPETGIKHQIRVHFGFGLSCPIMGDHKYSHLKKLAPQKLPSDILQRLNVRQSKVRHIPMHIYARSIVIPQYRDGRNLFVQAPMPIHMSLNLQRLKFKKN